MPRRQYVITLSGHGEVELNDGTKIDIPAASTWSATGLARVTSRVIGNEYRVRSRSCGRPLANSASTEPAI